MKKHIEVSLKVKSQYVALITVLLASLTTVLAACYQTQDAVCVAGPCETTSPNCGSTNYTGVPIMNDFRTIVRNTVGDESGYTTYFSGEEWECRWSCRITDCYNVEIDVPQNSMVTDAYLSGNICPED